MAYGRPATVRSHRRGGKRRRRVSRSLRAVVITALVVSGLVLGYTQLLARTCSGEEIVRVLASPATANHLNAFATDWSREEPSTEDGTCARVVVQGRDSAQVADELAAGWDVTAEEPPDVWVPAATAWAHKAAASELAEPLLPELLPSIARSPAVIAMPAPMAQELNWPETQVDSGGSGGEVRWESLLEEFGAEEGWAQFDRAEWGPFRFGMSNPARDTAGLLALTAVLDPAQDGTTTPEELEQAFTLSRLLEPEVYHETTEQLLIGLAQADQEGADGALRHVSAFPALEQEVLAYNRTNPAVPLAAVYPVDGTVEADHPYLVLNGEWATERKREVAELFLAYVRSDGPQAVLREAGFRGTNREPGADFVEQNGLVPELVALPRTVLAPDSVTLAIDRWAALTKRLNTLLVLDVSGSMSLAIPGTGELRMDRVKAAAAAVVETFADDDQLGLWEFAAGLDGDLDYRSLVPIGQLNDVMDDGRTRRDQARTAVDGLVPVDGSGLYNTIQAAYDTVLANYDEAVVNTVVIVTDGVDDTGERPTISLDQLLEHLQAAPADGQQVRVAIVAFGEDPDQAVLTQITEQTGGEVSYSEAGLDLDELLRTAVFNSVS